MTASKFDDSEIVLKLIYASILDIEYGSFGLHSLRLSNLNPMVELPNRPILTT